MPDETWNLSYGHALLETDIPAEKVVGRIVEWFRIYAWFRNDSRHNGVDIGAGNLVTEKAYEVIRKWQARDEQSTAAVTAGIWTDSSIYLYTHEPFGVKPGDLAYIRRYRGDLEFWEDYTVDVKVRVDGWVQDQTKGILKAACTVTGESIQFARGDRVTVPVNYIRPRAKRK